VRFRVADIFLPSAEEVLALSPTAELEGVVIDFSDSGSTSRVFAVVDVIRRQNVVVPVEKLEVVASYSENRSCS
jgi:D-arabinose 5-phosphate isomerase GutQ